MYREGDVQQALLRLGVLTEPRNRELQGYCPMHLERVGREDHNPSWSMNSETGVHHCFSCGYKGTLLTLVAEVQEMKTSWGRLDLEAAKEWLRANVEVDFEQLSKQLEEMRESYVSLARPVEMSEARLAVFDEVPEWALDARGLAKEACWAYGVMWDRRQEAWITPIRSAETSKLLGWQEKGQSNRVFRNRPTGVKKSTTLFGLDAWLGGTMIVVESPLDVVKLASLKLSQGVSTFGASVSSDQVELFRKADKLIFAFDNPSIDPAGEKASKEMFGLTKELGLECWFFNYGSTGLKDIGDMSHEQIEYGITKAKHCVFGEKAIYGD
jgi:DNA primase